METPGETERAARRHDNDNDKLPTTRDEARLIGATHYMTGEQCKHGHIAPRYTINGACVECTFQSKQRRKEADPDLWREITKEQRRRAFERDPERSRRHTREFMRRWRAANPELSKAMMREWRAANPEKAREYDANNSARRRRAEGNFSSKDVERLLKLQGFKCAECRKSVKTGYHVDHITPIARGGTNWPTNLQILCPPCNQHKHASDPIEFAQRKGRLL